MSTHVPKSPPRREAAVPRERPLQDASELLDSAAIGRTLARLAHELIEGSSDLHDVLLVGIQTRGVPLARRLQKLVAERSGVEVPVGELDVTPHRDDREGLERPGAERGDERATVVPVPLAGKSVVLVDDVLSTGRTVRAAIDALLELGRPARVQVAVLVDRGHRELPIRPDYVGKNVPTAAEEHVQLELVEVDGRDRVVLQREAADG
jgi:pyrimidine operon attenuation protein / uracil phosphoribosyltransferase